MRKPHRPASSFWLRLLCDRRGSLAPIVAIVGVVLVLAAGSAVDIGRAARLHSLLQDDADNAALAGSAQTTTSAATASAQAYVTAAVANLTDKPTVTATYTPSYNDTTGTMTMAVTLTASLPTTLMSSVVKSIPITVSSAASDAIVKSITISLTNFNSSAVDNDAIIAYAYNPSSYSTSNALYKFAPTSTTSPDLWKCVYANHTTSTCTATTSTAAITVQIPWADTIAFALSNQTETGGNCYGLSNGTTTMYYSHRLDSSGNYHDYPTTSLNYCGYATTTSNTDGTTTVDNYQAVTAGSNYANQCKTCEYQTYTYSCGSGWRQQTCTGTQAPSGATWNMSMSGDSKLDYGYVYPQTSSRNPLTLSASTQTCDGTSITYSWDDNGGGSDSNITTSNYKTSSGDDDDHNDVDFTVTCTKASSQSGAKLTS